jgi:hypothetical protein
LPVSEAFMVRVSLRLTMLPAGTYDVRTAGIL